MAKNKLVQAEETNNLSVENENMTEDIQLELSSEESSIEDNSELSTDSNNDSELPINNESEKEETFEVPVLVEHKEYTIVLTKKFVGQKEGTEKKVSGNVAMALIKKGVAKLK